MVGPILWSIEPLTFMCKGGLTIERRVASSRRISLPPHSLPRLLPHPANGEKIVFLFTLFTYASRASRDVTD